MEQPLFQKYGGFARISRIVMALYDRLLDDDDIGPFFDDVDMSRLVDHQTKFITSLMGGPASYTDDQLRKLHAHLTIEPKHFDILESILSQTLLEHGVGPEDVETVVGAFAERRDHVAGA